MKRKISILHQSDTFEFIITDAALITHIRRVDSSCQIQDILYDQVPVEVKKKLIRELKNYDS